MEASWTIDKPTNPENDAEPYFAWQNVKCSKSTKSSSTVNLAQVKVASWINELKHPKVKRKYMYVNRHLRCCFSRPPTV